MKKDTFTIILCILDVILVCAYIVIRYTPYKEYFNDIYMNVYMWGFLGLAHIAWFYSYLITLFEDTFLDTESKENIQRHEIEQKENNILVHNTINNNINICNNFFFMQPVEENLITENNDEKKIWH